MIKQIVLWIRTHKLFVALLFLGLLIAVSMLLVSVVRAPESQQGDSPRNDRPSYGQRITVKGRVLCLPPKDATQPHTLECAFGFKTEQGIYYGLRDNDASHRTVSGLEFNKDTTLTGTLEKATNSKYKTDGTIVLDTATQ